MGPSAPRSTHSEPSALRSSSPGDGSSGPPALRAQILAQIGYLRPTTQQRVFLAYLRDAPAAVARLRQLLQMDDPRALMEEAHCLRSSSATLGAASAAAFCQDLETSARSGDLSNAPWLLSLVADEVDRVVVELLRMVESSGGT